VSQHRFLCQDRRVAPRDSSCWRTTTHGCLRRTKPDRNAQHGLSEPELTVDINATRRTRPDRVEKRHVEIGALDGHAQAETLHEIARARPLRSLDLALKQSATPRSATAAPSAARSAFAIRPPNCRHASSHFDAEIEIVGPARATHGQASFFKRCRRPRFRLAMCSPPSVSRPAGADTPHRYSPSCPPPWRLTTPWWDCRMRAAPRQAPRPNLRLVYFGVGATPGRHSKGRTLRWRTGDVEEGA